MPTNNSKTDFVSLVAGEIFTGVDRAVEYWLARIEQQLGDARMTTMERIQAVELVLREYKNITGKKNLICVPA